MRLLVLSDSHGCSGAVYEIIEKEKSARHIFFLGDVVRDIESLIPLFPDRHFHIVSGNCDYFSEYPPFDTADVGERRILFAHGHTFFVKYGGFDNITKYAYEAGASIILYGHTHIADIDYRDGIYLINPGSVGRSRDGGNSYAVIDIEKNGVLPAIIRI